MRNLIILLPALLAIIALAACDAGVNVGNSSHNDTGSYTYDYTLSCHVSI